MYNSPTTYKACPKTCIKKQLTAITVTTYIILKEKRGLPYSCLYHNLEKKNNYTLHIMKAPSPHHVWQRDLQISSLPALLTLVTVTSKPCEWHFVNCTGQRKFLLNENTFNYDRTCYEELSTSSFIHDFFLFYFHPTYPVRVFFTVESSICEFPFSKF